MARHHDPLFLGLTRPTLVWGVTYNFVVLTLVLTGMAFVWTGSFLALAAGAPIHAAGYIACLREPRRFDLWFVRLRLCLPAPTRFFWGGNSYRP